MIFDLDDTLINSKLDFIIIKKNLINEYKTLGLEVSNMSINDSIQSLIDKVRVYEKNQNKNSNMLNWETLTKKILDRYEVKSVHKSTLKSDTKDILNNLLKLNIKIGLVTNSGIAATRIALDMHNINKYFSQVITRDDIQRIKPDSEGLLNMLRCLQIEAREAFYVGDSIYDIIAGNNIGINTIKLENKRNIITETTIGTPNYEIKTLSEIINLLF